MIKLQNVSKDFDNHRVIKNVNLDIKAGEIFGLIGKNGAGKTTLLSMIAGLIDITEGECLVDGNPVKRSGNNRVGYLPDVPAFFDFLTVGEYLDFLYKGKKNTLKEKEALVKRVGLEMKTIIKTMSRGNRQRLGLAATLINDPDVILLDEPSSALDPMGRYELSQLLLDLKKQGKTVILSTHILTEMEAVCDRVGFLHNGIIVKTMNADGGDRKKVRIEFRDPLDRSALSKLPFDMEFEKDNSFIIFGNMDDVEVQKVLMETIIAINNPIVHVEELGSDLDSVFREVCV